MQADLLVTEKPYDCLRIVKQIEQFKTGCLRIVKQTAFKDLRIVKELHRQFFLLLRLRGGCGLLARSATFRPHPTMSGRLSEERQWRRAVDTVCRLKMKRISKDFDVLFVRVEVFCTIRYFF
jgi:hypothetical protein